MHMTSSLWHRIGSIAWAAVLALTLISPVPAMAQQESSNDVEVSAVEVPPPDIQSEILTRLDSAVAATTRGVEAGAEFTWPILVRQQIAEGLVALSAAILTVTILLVGLRWQRIDRPPTDRSGDSIPGIAATLIGGMMSIFTIIWTFSEATKLINPQYHALEDILRMLGIS